MAPWLLTNPPSMELEGDPSIFFLRPPRNQNTCELCKMSRNYLCTGRPLGRSCSNNPAQKQTFTELVWLQSKNEEEREKKEQRQGARGETKKRREKKKEMGPTRLPSKTPCPYLIAIPRPPAPARPACTPRKALCSSDATC